MWKLEFCDIYRDGGSLGATLFDGTKHVSLFLQIARWDKRPPHSFVYESLWISYDQIPGRYAVEILPGSDAEREWLWQLENNVQADLSDDRYKPISESNLRHFSNLVATLRQRNP